MLCTEFVIPLVTSRWQHESSKSVPGALFYKFSDNFWKYYSQSCLFGINVVYQSWLLCLAEDLSMSQSCQVLVNIGVIVVVDSEQQPAVAKLHRSSLGNIGLLVVRLIQTCVTLPTTHIFHCFRKTVYGLFFFFILLKQKHNVS